MRYFGLNTAAMTIDRKLPFRVPQHSKSKISSKTAGVFFTLNIIQVLLVGGIQISMSQLGDFSSAESGGMGPGRRYYMILFFGAVFYSCFLCLFAVRQQNFLEIVAFVLQDYGYTVYSLIQVYHMNYKRANGNIINRTTSLKILSIVDSSLLLLLSIIFTVLAFKLYVEYGWKIYKRVRFNVKLRGAYRTYELVVCLTKMAFIFEAMFCVALNLTVYREHAGSVPSIIGWIAIPYCLVCSVVTVFSIRKESKLMFSIHFLCSLSLIFYNAFIVTRVVTDTCYACDTFSHQVDDIHDEVILHLVYLGSVSTLLITSLFLASLKALRNFGSGLRTHFRLSGNRALLGLHLSKTVLTSVLTSHVERETNHEIIDDLRHSIEPDYSETSCREYDPISPTALSRMSNELTEVENYLSDDEPPRMYSSPSHRQSRPDRRRGVLRFLQRRHQHRRRASHTTTSDTDYEDNTCCPSLYRRLIKKRLRHTSSLWSLDLADRDFDECVYGHSVLRSHALYDIGKTNDSAEVTNPRAVSIKRSKRMPKHEKSKLSDTSCKSSPKLKANNSADVNGVKNKHNQARKTLSAYNLYPRDGDEPRRGSLYSTSTCLSDVALSLKHNNSSELTSYSRSQSAQSLKGEVRSTSV